MVNQQSMSEKKAAGEVQQMLSIRENEKKVDMRLREVIGHESLASFGRRCGISEGGIRKYLNGASPSTENLVAMADVGNVNIEWLATGRGPKQRGAAHSIAPAPSQAPSTINVADLERLELAVESVEEGLAATRRMLPPSKYAQLIVAVYDLLADMEQKDNVIKFIKLAA